MVEVAALFCSSRAGILRPAIEAGAAERRSVVDLHAVGSCPDGQLARTSYLDSSRSPVLAKR